MRESFQLQRGSRQVEESGPHGLASFPGRWVKSVPVDVMLPQRLSRAEAR